MTFTRILVAVNLPNGPDAAFERALTLARASGAGLYLLHAVPVNQRFSFRAAERLERMATLRKRAQNAGVSVEIVEQQGDAAAIIELHADSRGVDLVVMGGDARRGWGHRPAVAVRVIRRTNVPVLVVPSDAPDASPGFRNLLVALDLSAGSTDVVSGAVALASEDSVQLTLMHTVTGLEASDAVQSPARWKVPEYRTYVLADAWRTLEGLASAIPADVNTRVQVSTGPPARAILEHAADANADLVVVGRSRGFTLFGSTALRVLRKNDRALLVVPGSAGGLGRVERQLAA